MLAHIKDGRNCWTVVVNNKGYQFDPSHKFYDKLVEYVKNGEGEKFAALMDTGVSIRNWSEGKFSINNGVLTYNGEQLDLVIGERILEMIDGGFDYKPMLRFVERLFKNPSRRAVEELYKFLEHKFLPITGDGYFLAYKAVVKYNGEPITDKMGKVINKGDLVDKYTGNSYRNNVGDAPEMVRNRVDDNCTVGCSHGLHVGSIDYVKSYGGGDCEIVICKVDPSDVVSVPLDHSCKKVRACKYEIVGIYEQEIDKAVDESYDSDDDYDDYDDEDEELEDPYANDGW